MRRCTQGRCASCGAGQAHSGAVLCAPPGGWALECRAAAGGVEGLLQGRGTSPIACVHKRGGPSLATLQAPVWTRYTEAELGPGGDTEAAKALFGRCLLSCPTVDLHVQYLRWVPRQGRQAWQSARGAAPPAALARPLPCPKGGHARLSRTGGTSRAHHPQPACLVHPMPPCSHARLPSCSHACSRARLPPCVQVREAQQRGARPGRAARAPPGV